MFLDDVLAAKVGGDGIDVWPLTGGAWSLACGDVEGHDPEAATLTSLARHTLHTAALTTDDPVEVLHLLNTTFRTTTERFCSCVFAHVRPTLSTMEVAFARGGHPYPIVVRADGTVQPVEVTGTLLGVFSRPSLELATITLEVGDSLVLYTDGLIEVRNHADEQFGEHRVAEVLGAGPRRTATELVDALHRAVSAHAATFNDDLTIVALTATGSVEISGVGNGFDQSLVVNGSPRSEPSLQSPFRDGCASVAIDPGAITEGASRGMAQALQLVGPDLRSCTLPPIAGCGCVASCRQAEESTARVSSSSVRVRCGPMG